MSYSSAGPHACAVFVFSACPFTGGTMHTLMVTTDAHTLVISGKILLRFFLQLFLKGVHHPDYLRQYDRPQAC
jgi:hypothetical protein